MTTPASAPARKPRQAAGKGGMPCLTIKKAAVPPESAMTEPTERSMSPPAITNTMPTAIMPTSVNASSRLKLLSRLPQKSGRR